MTHHMVAEIDREWLRQCRNAFLIRDPKAVLASYTAKRAGVVGHGRTIDRILCAHQ